MVQLYNPLVLRIKVLHFYSCTRDFTVEVLWIPGHAVKLDNEVADQLAVSSKYIVKSHIL